MHSKIAPWAQDFGYTYPSYVNVDMRRRLPSLWSVFQVSNSQIYEALCYLCTLSTVGQTLTFLSTQKRKFNTGFGNQASCSQTHYIIPLSSVCDKISQAFSKGGPEDMTSCHSNNWCTLMTFQAQKSWIQGSLYELSHNGHIVLD